MVADDVCQLCLLGICIHSEKMEESLISLSCLGSLVGRQQRSKFHCQTVGVYHLALGISGMHANTVYRNLGTCSIEVFVFQFTHVTTVHSVCPLTSEALYIKVMSSHANLLVGVESHAYVAVLYFLMVAQVAHSLYNLSNASLVVGTKKCVTVGHDKVLADML